MQRAIIHFLMQNAMGLTLLIVFGALLVAGWRAQKDEENHFNVWDLVMDERKASRTGTAFMMVLVITSWVVITQALKGQLSETVFGIYCAAWVTPLVAKVIFNKSEFTPPGLGPEPKHSEH